MRWWHSHCDVRDNPEFICEIELSNFTSLRRKFFMAKGFVLWLLGIPFGLIVVLWLFGFLT
jgi:hypothetical protein